MTSNSWWILVGLAWLVGLGLGAWASLRIARWRHAKQLRRALDELQQKYATTVEQLRTAQVRAQTELEQARNAFSRQLTAAGEEPRAAAARAEERLRDAYVELDRLRRNGLPAESRGSDLGDGFAATRPMHNGL